MKTKSVEIRLPAVPMDWFWNMRKGSRIAVSVAVAFFIACAIIAPITYIGLPRSEVLAEQSMVEMGGKGNTLMVNPAKYHTWNVQSGRDVGYDIAITNMSDSTKLYRIDASALVPASIRLYVVEGEGTRIKLFDKPANFEVEGGRGIVIRVTVVPTKDTEVRVSVGCLTGTEFYTKFVSRWTISTK